MVAMSNSGYPRKFGELAPSSFPGERLGLQEYGSGSVARVGRRLSALIVDWLGAMLIAYLAVPPELVSAATLLVFAVLQVAFITIWGGSLGHLLFGMRIILLTGAQRICLWRSLLRTLLLVIVIPALVWDSDQRGFHDKIPGTVLVRV